MNRSSFGIALAVATALPPLAQAEWTFSTIHSPRSNSYIGPPKVAMALQGTRNAVFVAYQDTTDRSIQVAMPQGPGWASTKIEELGGLLLTEFISIAAGANGQPHLAYLDPGPKRLRYATWASPGTGNCGGGNWLCETIPPVATGFPAGIAIAIDSSGTPAVAFNMVSKQPLPWPSYEHWLIYARRPSSGWASEIARSQSFGDYFKVRSLIHVAGVPQIFVGSGYPGPSYASNGLFRRVAPGPWQWEPVDTSSLAGELTNENGVRSVCTNSWSLTNLNYGATSGVAWSLNPVFPSELYPNDQAYRIGYQCSLANGDPAIAYIGYDGELAVAKKSFLFWSKEVLAAHGESPKIVRGGSGKLMVAYSETNGTIRFAREQ